MLSIPLSHKKPNRQDWLFFFWHSSMFILLGYATSLSNYFFISLIYFVTEGVHDKSDSISSMRSMKSSRTSESCSFFSTQHGYTISMRLVG